MKPAFIAIAVSCSILAGCAPDSEPADAEARAHSSRSWRDELPPAALPANQPSGAEFHLRALEDRLYAEGRGNDQQSNPDYLARIGVAHTAFAEHPPTTPEDYLAQRDPYRTDWEGRRGVAQDVEFPNRYGALLRGKLWGPIDNAGPLPAIIFLPAYVSQRAGSRYTGFAQYEAQLQQLAENGYVVLAVGPSGQEGSEYFEPPHPMCDPNGWWREPQEMGIREQGPCAGQYGAFAPFTGENSEIYNAAGPAGGFALQSRLDEKNLNGTLASDYELYRPVMVFSALDAAKWMLSNDNPWRARVDGERLGMLGYSAGADGALVAANGDPQRRFKAAVSWDGYGLPPDTVQPRVPTLMMRSEQQDMRGPFFEPPQDHYWNPYRVYRRFAEDKGDAMLVTLRGSTHPDFVYTPYPVSLSGASSRGNLVAHYFALAWFDRWLKGGAGKEAARRRLLAREFDASADASSIGVGTFDPLTQQNAPYRLEGDALADHLSVFFLSQVHFDGVACEDLQAACP